MRQDRDEGGKLLEHLRKGSQLSESNKTAPFWRNAVTICCVGEWFARFDKPRMMQAATSIQRPNDDS